MDKQNLITEISASEIIFAADPLDGLGNYDLRQLTSQSSGIGISEIIGQGSINAFLPRTSSYIFEKKSRDLVDEILIADHKGSLSLITNGSVPKVSPDGRFIGFLNYVEDRFCNIFCTINIDGTGRRELSLPAYDSFTIASNGLIAVPYENKITIIDKYGSIVRELNGHHPSFSPDGLLLAYDSREGKKSFENSDISVVHAETGAVIHTLDGSEPIFSRDGNRLVYRTYSPFSGESTHIYTLDTEQSINICDHGKSPFRVVWSPSDNFISIEAHIKAQGSPIISGSCIYMYATDQPQKKPMMTIPNAHYLSWSGFIK
ncbi:MAG: hypothetical protein HGA85_00085 [Nanoarchaeota archaeon]|nr:hypothetical protein [Nanoarchaeota archaeon]